MIGAVCLGGQLAAIGALGIRKIGSSQPIQIDDQMHMGSCTKAMTATMIGSLVEAGKLSWKSNFRTMFPESAEEFHPQFQDATLSHLLTHRGSTSPTWTRPTTSTATSPTTTSGRPWWPGTRPRPTAWPASGSTPATRPRAAPSTPSGPCPTRSRQVVRSVDCELLVLSYNDESWLSRRGARGAVRRGPGDVATLAFDSARYVGARIGIFDPSGRKVGQVSHLSNQELLVIAGEASSAVPSASSTPWRPLRAADPRAMHGGPRTRGPRIGFNRRRDHPPHAYARLEDADLSAGCPKDEEAKRLQQGAAAAAPPSAYQRRPAQRGHSGPPVCIVFEGWDAAGKGGAIKRLVEPLDPRHVHIAPFAAPTPDELRHHFLWRFWPPLPGWGGMTIFDRSWYGRVLVERVENLATEVQWRRAYDEINDFEHSLAEEGMIVIKLWMHMSHEEQFRSFERRRDDPLKSWKLTEEDWRNREKRPQYDEAVSDMLRLTDGRFAPWDVISSENKRNGRVEVIETVIRRMEEGMARWGSPCPPDDEEEQRTELALPSTTPSTSPTQNPRPARMAIPTGASDSRRQRAPTDGGTSLTTRSPWTAAPAPLDMNLRPST